MERRVSERLNDIIGAIDNIYSLLGDRQFSDVDGDQHLRAAFERYMEIVSEASRHIPPALKEKAATIPWQDIANIGNHLRHAYNRVEADVLWKTYEDGELNDLRSACVILLQFS